MEIINRTIQGQSPFFYAVLTNNSVFVTYFLDNWFVNIEQRCVFYDDTGTNHMVSPLWCAAVQNCEDIVKLLIRHNASVDAPSDTMCTPLRAACVLGHTHIASILLERDSNPNTPNVHGGTCLMSAIRTNNFKLCNLLLKYGARIKDEDDCGHSSSYFAIRCTNRNIKTLILRNDDNLEDAHTFPDSQATDILISLEDEIIPYHVNESERNVHPSMTKTSDALHKDGSDVPTSKHKENTKRTPITIDIAPYASIGKLVKTDDSRASRSPENTTETSPGLRIGKDKSTTDSQTSKATLRQNTETEPSNNPRNSTPTMVPNDAEKHRVTSGVSQKKELQHEKDLHRQTVQQEGHLHRRAVQLKRRDHHHPLIQAKTLPEK